MKSHGRFGIKRFWSELGQDVRDGRRIMIAEQGIQCPGRSCCSRSASGYILPSTTLMELILFAALPVADPESLVA